MKICSNCKTEAQDSANFCHICGGSDFFSPAEPAPEEHSAAEPVAAEAPISVEPVQAASVPEEPAAEEPVQEEPVQDEPIREEPIVQVPASTVPENFSYYTDAGVVTPEPQPKKKPSKGMIIGICAGVVALIAAIVVITTLTNPVRRFMNAIQEGDSPAAAEIYYNSIISSDDRSEKVSAELSAYASDLLQQYLDGTLTYDSLTANLWVIDAASVYNEDVYNALDRAYYVESCRTAFQSAQEAFSSGDYALAISLYSQVAGADFENGEAATARLAESTELYRSEILETVSAYQEDHAFDSAYALLNEAQYVLPGDPALQNAYEQCVQAQYDYTIDCLIAEAQVYYGTNDYLGALAYLDEQIGAYPDEVRLQDERNSCLKLFEEYVITESLRVAREGDFVHASSLTASGLSCFESAQVTELHQIYLSHIPVILGEMEIFKNDTEGGSWSVNTNKTDKYLEDKYGGTYTHSLSVGCGSLTYLVNFKYDTFTGIVGFPKGLTADNARKSATLTIYGDGQQLAVFRNVTDTTKPIAFDLDISDFEKITLTWEAKGANAWEDWGDFATIFDGILTPIPLELPESIG